MNNIKFLHGTKEEMHRKYLTELFNLFIKNEEEIFPYKAPSIEYYRKQWVTPLNSWVKKHYVIAVNEHEEILGYGYFSWNIKYDNLDKGFFWVYVKQEERRKGIGKKILHELFRNIPPQINCILTEAMENTEAVHYLSKFANKYSYKEILSSVSLTLFNKEEIKSKALEHKRAAREKGFDIIYVSDMDYALEVDFGEFVKVVEEIWRDMPLEELTFEDEVITPERFIEMNQRNLLFGSHFMTFIAVEQETNKIAGYTTTLINKYQPQIAFQDDTGVLKKYRGKGLGLALKYQMLEILLFETDAKYWTTGNAGSNEYMLKINQTLNFKPFSNYFVYEFPKEKLQEKIERLILESKK